MKIKIRKVEVTPEEFFEVLGEILHVDEKIPQNRYMGSDLSFICKSLGIKTLEFWVLKFKFEHEFDKLFVIRKIGPDAGVFSIWRKELHDRITNDEKSLR